MTLPSEREHNEARAFWHNAGFTVYVLTFQRLKGRRVLDSRTRYVRAQSAEGARNNINARPLGKGWKLTALRMALPSELGR